MQNKMFDLSEFVQAVKEANLSINASEIKATAHTSAVSVKDWDKVQSALKESK